MLCAAQRLPRRPSAAYRAVERQPGPHLSSHSWVSLLGLLPSMALDRGLAPPAGTAQPLPQTLRSGVRTGRGLQRGASAREASSWAGHWTQAGWRPPLACPDLWLLGALTVVAELSSCQGLPGPPTLKHLRLAYPAAAASPRLEQAHGGHAGSPMPGRAERKGPACRLESLAPAPILSPSWGWLHG